MRFYYTRASERTILRPDGPWYEPRITEITSYDPDLLGGRGIIPITSVIITPSLSRGALLPYFIPSILPSASSSSAYSTLSLAPASKVILREPPPRRCHLHRE